MNDALLLYVITRLDVVNGLVTLIAVVSSVIYVSTRFFSFLVHVEASNNTHAGRVEHYERWLQYWKSAGKIKWLAIPMVILAVLLPSKQDVFFVVGGSVLLETIKSDRAGRIGTKSLDAVERWLDQNMPPPEKVGKKSE